MMKVSHFDPQSIMLLAKPLRSFLLVEFECRVSRRVEVLSGRTKEVMEDLKWAVFHLSNEKGPLVVVGTKGDYTTQLYRDYNKPL